MSSKIKDLIEQFEYEVWLYLDKDLPQERMQFWSDKINQHPELKSIIDENKKIVTLYEEIPLNQLNEHRYTELVNNAVKKRNPIIEFFISINPFSKENESWLNPAKIAFGGVMVAAAVVVLVLSNKPNPVNNIDNISKELLDWNSDNISQQISRVGTSISLIKDENFREFIEEKRSKEKLDRDIFSISDEIKKLQEEINEHSL